MEKQQTSIPAPRTTRTPKLSSCAESKDLRLSLLKRNPPVACVRTQFSPHLYRREQQGWRLFLPRTSCYSSSPQTNQPINAEDCSPPHSQSLDALSNLQTPDSTRRIPWPHLPNISCPRRILTRRAFRPQMPQAPGTAQSDNASSAALLERKQPESPLTPLPTNFCG